uniref:EGF-like domain-containing protein n=1 Tax=Setaria digitata TaxID=48799 RepID=A0A915Q214_9BILA
MHRYYNSKVKLLNSYGGETCDDYLCENNGTKVTNGCKCPEGFSGSHCQNVICDNSAKLKNIDSDHNNLVFIVRAQKQLATIVNNIATFIPDNKECLPEYIQQYALIAFSEGQILRKEVYPTANAFQQAVHEVMTTNVSLSTCEDFVLITLHEVLNDQKIVNNRSTIYIITDATPQRYHDTAAKLKVMVSNKYNIPIYVVLFYKNSCSTGLGPRRWFDLSQTELNYIVAASSGQIFDYWIDSNEYINVLRDHIQFTYFRSNLAYGIYGCRTRFDDFPEATVENQLIRDEPNNIHQNTTHSQIKILKSLPIGQHWNDFGETFNGSRTAYRLYEGSEVCASRRTHNIFWGFSTDRIIDKSLVQPLEDLPLALVIRMNGLKVNDPKLLRADLFIYYQHISNMIYMSSGIWREDCTFQLYFQPTKYPPKKALSFTVTLLIQL